MGRVPPTLLLACFASPAWAETLASGSAPGIPWLRLLFSFALCIVLAWGAAMLLRHYQRRGIGNPLKGLLLRQSSATPRRIAILETRRASLHADLCLVECDGATYFLALTPAGTVVLHRQGTEEADG